MVHAAGQIQHLEASDDRFYGVFVIVHDLKL
jgi:hypothetical protein